uniref:Si:ch211-284e13.11 n=2 Tax=Pygocentrus nattereri TaxID=42514 RepID=A0A3B4CAS9_PYGNA
MLVQSRKIGIMSDSASLPKCPVCHKTDVKKLDGQCILCRRCSETMRRVYRFCGACLREWSNGCPVDSACNLPDCALRAALLSTKRINDPNCSVYRCPYFRACPTCRALLTHTGQGCPNIVCPHCHMGFCFRCLRQNCYGEDDSDSDFELQDPRIEQCTIVKNSSCLAALKL